MSCLFVGVDYLLLGCEEGRDWRGMGAFDLFIYLILQDFFTESDRCIDHNEDKYTLRMEVDSVVMICLLMGTL